jgi:hypothetical protein
MQEVPGGALALSGLTVGLLLLAWFLIYAGDLGSRKKMGIRVGSRGGPGATICHDGELPPRSKAMTAKPVGAA